MSIMLNEICIHIYIYIYSLFQKKTKNKPTIGHIKINYFHPVKSIDINHWSKKLTRLLQIKQEWIKIFFSHSKPDYKNKQKKKLISPI